MKIVEIITIGREILDGRVIDTNAAFLGEELSRRGLVPRHSQRVDDDLGRIVEAFCIAANRAQLILITGGLGPTSDDLTAAAFARFLGEKLSLNAEALSQIKAYFARVKREFIPAQEKQAHLAPSCFVIPNVEGSAPGFGFRDDNTQWFFMPGVPKEMKQMFLGEISPLIGVDGTYRSWSWATQFTSEGELQQRLNAFTQTLPPHFELSYRTRFPENHIGLHASCTNSGDAALFDKCAATLTELLGAEVFSEGTKLQLLEEVVFEKLRTAGYRISTVESCTGGLVANRITDVPGSSEVFWQGHIVYDNKAKLDLGVDSALLAAHGAVSPEVAKALAEKGLERLQSLAGAWPKLATIAATGIAGPGGGTELKPVGLCYIALACRAQPTLCQEIRARPGLDRRLAKVLFSQKSLDLLRLNTH